MKRNYWISFENLLKVDAETEEDEILSFYRLKNTRIKVLILFEIVVKFLSKKINEF